jgi:hypothetical protein
MGMLVCVTLTLGALLIIKAPNRIVAVTDLTNCYAPPPIALPCDRIVYRGGALDAAFTALCGLTLIGVAVWFLWELWGTVEPKPITDDFLKLLNDSFGRNWRHPRTWPWSRLVWAYGFPFLGAAMTAVVGVMIWTLTMSSASARPPAARIDTSQSFRLE